MTAIVGILCQQGVVIGTDSAATFVSGQHPTMEQPTEKLIVIGNSVVVVGTGQVGLDQRFQAIVEKAWGDGTFNKSSIEIGKYLSKTMIDDFAYTYAQKGTYGALVSFPAEQKAQLCEFAVQDFQPEFKTKDLWYCSMGSTQPITDPFLALMRDIFKQTGPPPVNEGIFVVNWALEHAVEVNPGGVNRPIRIAVLHPDNAGKFNVDVLSNVVLGEHGQSIRGAKDAVLKYYTSLHEFTEKETPDIPRPP